MKLKLPIKKLAGLLTGLAFVMILSQTTGNSMAHFTTYVTAAGSRSVSYIAPDSEIKEDYVENGVKYVQIENTGEVPCYVRVKFLAGGLFAENMVISGESENWTAGDDGYWYYSAIVPAGESTETITASITVPEGYKDNFNVIVVQECTPVSYRGNGTPYADWTL